MKKLFALAILALLGFAAPCQADVPVIGPLTYTFTAASQSNVWTCNGGQSSFQLTVPSGLTGTFTVTVAQTSSGTYSNPPWAYAPGSTVYTNTITNSGTLTVNLGSNYYVKVADTSYTSGSVTVMGGCSSAVALFPPGAPFRIGSQAAVAADGSAASSVTYTGGAFSATPHSVVVFPVTYSGTDNAAIFCLGSSITSSGFSVLCGGGQSGSTVTVNYIAGA